MPVFVSTGSRRFFRKSTLSLVVFKSWSRCGLSGNGLSIPPSVPRSTLSRLRAFLLSLWIWAVDSVIWQVQGISGRLAFVSFPKIELASYRFRRKGLVLPCGCLIFPLFEFYFIAPSRLLGGKTSQWKNDGRVIFHVNTLNLQYNLGDLSRGYYDR